MIPSAIALTALLAFQVVAGAPVLSPAQTGEAPLPTLGARDIFTEFKLPALQDHPGDKVWLTAHKLQVMERARLMHLQASSATEAWTEAEETYRLAKQTMQAPAPSGATVFNGTLASQLNAALAGSGVTAVVVTSPALEFDTPIHLGSNISLDLGNATLRLTGNEPYMIRIEAAHDVRLSGGSLVSGNWGVLVSGSSHVAITGMDVHDLAGGGLMITASHDVVAWGNKLHALRAAGILLIGVTHQVTLVNNEMVHNLGSSNWHAGVVLTDRNADVASDPATLLAPDGFWVQPQPMTQRLKVPQDNLVAFNHIADNGSSGVYSDGSIRNVIVGNRIERNAKEGLCLDDGSTADVLAWNSFRANGKRWGKNDEDLKKEFVFGLGRLPDGTSPAKVPAISLDNAAFNQIMFNQIDGNFGGGVKMVRTGFYNVIGLNTLTDDNEGKSEHFHFFGIELGAAKGDAPSIELDFLPSQGNEIFGNIIRGSHYSGIFFADGSDRNNVFDNSIFGATDWAMESVKAQPEFVLNNLTNLKLRNIGSGLDPKLLTVGAGVFDTPPPPPPEAAGATPSKPRAASPPSASPQPTGSARPAGPPGP